MAEALDQRPWSKVPISDRGEPLLPLPPQLHRLEPHPYLALGAPYGAGLSPFRLRRHVVDRLLGAQAELQRQEPQWRLAIFDGWRPVGVQAFMVDHAFKNECVLRGLDPGGDPIALAGVYEAVARFWAPPSENPLTPPPHSTGAAVDLTLADTHGAPLAMGGEIDDIGAISEPDYYSAQSVEEPGSREGQWHRNRQLLAYVMAAAGFAQHPHEWWHFSYGDQLWAWRKNETRACYGRTPD